MVIFHLFEKIRDYFCNARAGHDILADHLLLPQQVRRQGAAFYKSDTMTPPIGCVAKPRTAGGKQPHAQVLKQHVRGAWTYLCQRDLQLQAHPREVASFFHWHPGETHEEALARPARFATNSFACFAAKVRLDLCCQQCPNSQRDRRSAEKFSVKTRRCTP